MKKKLFALITCVIMVAAITAPVLAEEASPEITTRSMPPIGQSIKIGNGYTVDLWLTVASFASAGNNDPVYVWSNRGMATQNWKLARFPYNASYYMICPADQPSLALNVYRAGSYPCTVLTWASNDQSDYKIQLQDWAPSDPNTAISYIYMVDRARYLTATDTAASKFSDGYGYTTAWQSLVTDSTAGRQHWYLRR